MTYLNRFITCIIALAITLALIHYSNLDLKFQSLFFISEGNQWLVSRDDLELKFWFYKLPKYLIGTYGVCIIFWLSKLKFDNHNIELQKKLLFLVIALILTPVVVAILKHYSPIYCPNFAKEFGGGSSYISPLDIFNYDVFFGNMGKCSPAGHASGGFALISLYFVMPTRHLKLASLSISLAIGSIMGLYQIAKGTHYLSDTIITLALAYLVCISLEKLILKKYISNPN